HEDGGTAPDRVRIAVEDLAHVAEIVAENLDRRRDFGVELEMLSRGLGRTLVRVRVVTAVRELEEMGTDVRHVSLDAVDDLCDLTEITRRARRDPAVELVERPAFVGVLAV